MCVCARARARARGRAGMALMSRGRTGISLMSRPAVAVCVAVCIAVCGSCGRVAARIVRCTVSLCRFRREARAGPGRWLLLSSMAVGRGGCAHGTACALRQDISSAGDASAAIVLTVLYCAPRMCGLSDVGEHDKIGRRVSTVVGRMCEWVEAVEVRAGGFVVYVC